jgi:Flp pilus assembly protein TadG
LGAWAGRERGNAAAELALALPVLVAITFGAVDFARLFYAYVTITSAAHEASSYWVQNATATDADLQAAAVAESQGASTMLSFSGGTANTTLTRINTNATGTVNTTMFVRLQLAYSFRPLTPFPIRGPIQISAVADAPKYRVLT